jgi:transcription antitermination factor NusG
VTSKISTAGPWDSNGRAIARKKLAETDAAKPAAASWYAVQTRLRVEKKVESLLRLRGTETFLPLLEHVSRWSDRRKTITSPLFSGYVFARLQPTREQRLPILQMSGVLGFAGPADRPASIPDSQIEALRLLLKADTQCTIRPFLRSGQRVRIRGGALDGLEGFLHEGGGRHLVISIDCIQRAVSVQVEGYDLEVA